MRLRPLAPALLLALGLSGACLRTPPPLSGKLCTPGSKECGAGLACVSQLGGQPLPLDGGLCAESPSSCAGMTCPPDAGLYVCADHTCFAGGIRELAGSECFTGQGRCAGRGLFFWAGDAGACLVPDAGHTALPECRQAGPSGVRCLCDGVDDDCNGLVDDAPARPAVALPGRADLGAANASACPDALDGGVDLGSSNSVTLGGQAVSGCARFDLGAPYSLETVTLTATPLLTACGLATGGPDARLLVFGLPAGDGGAWLIGALDGGSGTLPVRAGVLRLEACVPAGAFSALRVGPAQVEFGRRCDPE